MIYAAKQRENCTILLEIAIKILMSKDTNKCQCIVNPFTTTNRFSSFQNNELKSQLKLLSVERVKILQSE